MHSSKDLRFRTLLSLALALLFPAVMAAQSEGAAPSAESSRNNSFERRLGKHSAAL